MTQLIGRVLRKQRIVRAVARRVRAAVRRAPVVGAPPDPLLSVIIPVYNVEKYLAECLDSVVQQTYPNIEVILVDDGSTDRSREIAESYADADSRFRIVTQTNAGLGAARNTGVRHSSGEYLVFLDSDDAIPEDAYTRMMGVLTRSGSDFIVGSFLRQHLGIYREPSWVQKIHSERRVGVTIEQHPDALANIFAWNKIFRRTFWDGAKLAFPVGVRYEDQVPMTQAYLDAGSFDMVSAVVYRWRTRQDGTSITQQKADAADLQDRLTAKRDVARMIQSHGSAHARAAWFAKVLTFDFPSYYRVALSSEPEYWRVLSTSLADLVEQMPAGAWQHLPVQFRILAWLVSGGHRDETNELLGFLDFHKRGFKVRRLEDGRYADLPFFDDRSLEIPPALYEFHAADCTAQTRLFDVAWEEGTLLIRGAAFMHYIDDEAITKKLVLFERRTGASLQLDVSRINDSSINNWAGRAWEDHSAAGFVARVSAEMLVDASRAQSGERPALWDVKVVMHAEGHSVTSPLQSRVARSVGDLWTPEVHGGSLVQPRWVHKLGVVLSVEHRFALATAGAVTAQSVALDLRTDAGADLASVVVVGSGDESPAEVRQTGPGTFSALLTVPSDIRVEARAARELMARFTPRGRSPVLAGELESWIGDHAVAHGLCHGPEGSLQLTAGEPVLLIDTVAMNREGNLLFRGRAVGTEPHAVGLVGPRFSTDPVPVSCSDGEFEVNVSMRARLWPHLPETTLPGDRYAVEAIAADGSVQRVIASHALHRRMPATIDFGSESFRLEVEPLDAALFVKIESALGLAERGQYNQHRLISTVYEAARSGPRRPTVLFECFNGKSVSDHPRAICEELQARKSDLELVWSVADPAIAVPPGTRAVLRGSVDWYETLGSAAFLVSNSNFPSYFKKAEGQIHLQTWHGTPLKKIGHDVATLQFAGDTYLAVMDAEAANWDFLVSPSPFCSEIFPRAFAYDGTLLEVGSPRDDALVSPAALSARARIRRELGLGDEDNVVLYAPTWRETARVGGSYEKLLYLDAQRLVDADEDCVVLIRGHANTSARPGAEGVGQRVVDVTLYPDITDLYLAADALITDYSSVMFDFALTDKPMFFLVPDLEYYRDSVRGFYFDFAAWAPGPLLRTSDEVLVALGSPTDDYAEQRKAFRERFSPLEDGKAAKRVVDTVIDRSSWDD